MKSIQQAIRVHVTDVADALGGRVSRLVWCWAIVGGVLLVLGCTKKTSALTESTTPNLPAPAPVLAAEAPMIWTLIFEEYADQDSLSLKHQIRSRGYLKRSLEKRVEPQTGDQFLFTVFGVNGDTLGQMRAASGLNETLETADEAGEFIEVPVQHAVAAHTLRYVGASIVRAEVTIFDLSGEVLLRQRFALHED